MSDPCLACGGKTSITSGRVIVRAPVFMGAVGPFCSDICRDKQQDVKVWERANAYAGRVVDMLATLTAPDYATPTHAPIEQSDIARAFVIGYAAGLEDGQATAGRRTVKK